MLCTVLFCSLQFQKCTPIIPRFLSKMFQAASEDIIFTCCYVKQDSFDAAATTVDSTEHTSQKEDTLSFAYWRSREWYCWHNHMA